MVFDMSQIRQNEVFVGNTKADLELSHLSGIRYRKGVLALDILGRKIEPSYMLPIFIHKDDILEYDRIMSNL